MSPATRVAPTNSAARLGGLRQELAALLDEAGSQASWSVAVQSLSSNERLFVRDAQRLLVPGSTIKLMTAVTAAEAVGWDYTFTTQADITGPVTDGVLQGDLLLRGSGDPALHGRGGTELVPALAAALRARGIGRIAGRVIGDDSLVEDARPGLAWSWDDLGTRTGTLAGALNIDENVMRITVAPGATTGVAARVSGPAEASDLPITASAITTGAGTPSSVWPEARPGQVGLVIAGAIASDSPPLVVTAAVGNPTRWFAGVVRTRLIATGIAVDGAAVDGDDIGPLPASVTPLLTHRSHTLAEVIRPMLKDSINMYAEAVLKLATGPAGVRDTGAALSAERGYLDGWGLDTRAIRLADGSGLSRWNVVSADTLVGLLVRQQAMAPFVDALPIAGRDGTLAGRMVGTPAAGNARAKSGSMTHVRSLAGYVTTADGERLAFAVIANNTGLTGPMLDGVIDRLVARLAAFRR